MFAPESYIRWTDVQRELFEWSYRLILAHHLDTKGKDTTFAFEDLTNAEHVLRGCDFQNLYKKYPTAKTKNEGKITDIDAHNALIDELTQIEEERSFTAALFTHNMMGKVLEFFDTLICSPDGKVLRAPNDLFIHGDSLEYCPISYPARDEPEYNNYFKLFDEINFTGGDIGERFGFIDCLKGLVIIKNNSKEMYEASSAGVYGGGSDYQNFIKTLVEPFRGWSIVWNSNNFPNEIRTVVDLAGGLREHWSFPEDSQLNFKNANKRVKRGAKPTGARSEFYRRYPDGKPPELSADAIAAELTEAGFPITGRMISYYELERNKS